MRLWILPVIASVALWCGGCVQGPLVDFGNRDKPFVDIKVGQDNDTAGKDKKDKKDKKSSDKSGDTNPF